MEIIPKEKGYIIRACNQAFHFVKGGLPERIRESHDYDQPLASILGFFVGGVGVSSLGKWAIEKANEHGTNLDLESITSHCLAATVAAPFIAYGIAPDKVREMSNEDPVYTTGVIAVMAGASARAIQVLL
jgi:hypothetical protein